ncbi:hypothetical protein [Nonomuraea sp. NPDC050540]|uniref:hypothetical protein n=1 Tax=Nonomuraea sp. NPDC050540 TaxID=3364367 RepID=UPI0037BB6C6B
MARRNPRRDRSHRPRHDGRWGDEAPHRSSGYYRDRITFGRVLGAAMRGYARWVARSPDTRGLATGLTALYPAGQLAHLMQLPDPLWVAAPSAPLALAAWTATYRKHRSKSYSATVAATVAAVPGWLAFAAHAGAFTLPTLAVYSGAAALAWSAYTWSDVLRERRNWQAECAGWEHLAQAASLTDSRLISVKDVRLGKRYRVDIRKTGKRASQLAGSNNAMAEDIAGALALPRERVKVTDYHKHAGIIIVDVHTVDPWQGKVESPALTSQTAPTPRRSIMDGPLVIGFDPDSGRDMPLVVFDRAGGHHTFIVAPTGSGKTVLYCNIIEQATACRDVLVWGIDLGKGTLGAIWGDALDAYAGIDEYDRALQILTWADQVIKYRSLKSGGRNHVPSPSEPFILIPIDELDELAGYNSPIGHKAKPLFETIYRRGRSAGVGVATASQRGVVQYTGTKDPHANADNKIVLRLNRASEMGNVIPDWQIDGMPNMVSYARGVKGVALVVDGENLWSAGRVRNMSDLDAVEALAHTRGAPAATLEPDLAAAMDGYADRRRVRAAAGSGTGRGPTPAPNSGWGIDPADPGAVERLAHDLVADVESRLAGMPDPPEHATSLDDLVAAKQLFDNAESNDPGLNRGITIPAHIAQPVLTLLDERGPEGASPADLVKATGKPESTVRRWLAIMRDQGLTISRGSTRAARYYLPEHAPDDHEE